MNNRELVVKGVGKVTVPPDLIIINITVEASSPQYEKTMQLGSEKLDKLRVAIESIGYDRKDLKTISFDINTKNDRYRGNDSGMQHYATFALQ